MSRAGFQKEQIDRLITRVDVIIKLMVISNETLLERLRNEIRRNLDVLRLCDGKNNLSDIAKITGRDKSNLSKTLSRLEMNGFIYIDRQEGVEKYYKCILPLNILLLRKGESDEQS